MALFPHPDFAISTFSTPPSGTVGTTFTASVGTGARFPDPNLVGSYIIVARHAGSPATPQSAEKMLLTARVNDLFTVQRGYDGSTLQTFVLGDPFYFALLDLHLDIIESGLVHNIGYGAAAQVQDVSLASEDAGSSALIARADHRHFFNGTPLQYVEPGYGNTGHIQDVDGGAEDAGSSNLWARADHKHALVQQTHGASLHDNVTRVFPIPLGAFLLRGGTPSVVVLGTNLRYWGWAFDPTASENIIGSFIIPDDYVSGGTFTMYWSNSGAGSGNVVWEVTNKAQAAAIDLNSLTSEQLNSDIIAAPTLGVLKVSTLTSVLGNGADWVAGNHVRMMINRNAVSASDTHTSDAVIVGLTFSYTASQ